MYSGLGEVLTMAGVFCILLICSAGKLCHLRREATLIVLFSIIMFGTILTVLLAVLTGNEIIAFIGVGFIEIGYCYLTIYFLRLSSNFRNCFTPNSDTEKRCVDGFFVLLYLVFTAGPVVLTYNILRSEGNSTRLFYNQILFGLLYLGFGICQLITAIRLRNFSKLLKVKRHKQRIFNVQITVLSVGVVV
jgi:uncharacterized membrane protein